MVLLASCQPALVNIQMVLLDLDATYTYFRFENPWAQIVGGLVELGLFPTSLCLNARAH